MRQVAPKEERSGILFYMLRIGSSIQRFILETLSQPFGYLVQSAIIHSKTTVNVAHEVHQEFFPYKVLQLALQLVCILSWTSGPSK